MDIYPGDEVVVPRWTEGDIDMPEITLQNLNSQAAEQCNSKLDLIASQVAYMTQSNFMSVVKYYLFRCNQRIMERFQVPV